MPEDYSYDGDYAIRGQVGGHTTDELLATRSRLYRVKYHQLRTVFDEGIARYNDMGEADTLWAGLPLVEHSPATDLGAGLCEWTATYATVPPDRPEYEQFAYEYQFIYAGELVSIPLMVPSKIVYSYQHTVNPDAITLAHAFRITQVTEGLRLITGTQPAVGATSFLGEDETKTRWKGNIWEKKSRFVPALTYSALT